MNMQTGFGDTGNGLMEQYIETMTNIMVPVFEKSAKLATEYSKACGRDVLLPEDMEYAMKYCTMYKVGEDIGSIFPEIYENIEEEEISDEEMPTVPPEECPPFKRYTGTDPLFLQMNEAYDRWESWVPQSPVEALLKNAVNNNEHIRA